MIALVITYQDLALEGKHGFQDVFKPTPEMLIAKEMVVPGMYGYLPLYIRHIKGAVDEQPFLIITKTDYELDQKKKEQIVRNAIPLIIEALFHPSTPDER